MGANRLLLHMGVLWGRTAHIAPTAPILTVATVEVRMARVDIQWEESGEI